ncbi:MAG TPA: hypothetical protein PLU53_05550 [Bacteroidia bacterium]|nr:hypothetical protein [Bacteroidia bacterium]
MTGISAIKDKAVLKKTVLFCCYLIAVAFSIKSLREPDLWWQIRTGEWILRHGSVPMQDVFSYTRAGSLWVNIKWGFDVIAAAISRAVGPESVCFLQVIVSCFIFFFLFRTADLVFRSLRPVLTVNEERTYVLSLFVSFVLSVLAFEYRMNSRPEMMSHLFTVVFTFILLKYRKMPSRIIFLLIPLQILWANLHEAFGIGIVIQAIFFAASVTEQWKERGILLVKNKTAILLPGVVLLASIASIAINPAGTTLITRPLNIFGQVFQNKYTTELLPVSSVFYWQKEAYIALFILSIVLAGFFLIKKEKKYKTGRVSLIIKTYGTGHLLLLLAFTFLALTAYRNIAFLVLVFFPLTVVSVFLVCMKLVDKMKNSLPLNPAPITMSVGLIGFVLYALIVSNTYYRITGSRDRYGAEVSGAYHPVGAANYIAKKGLQQKRGFSDYMTSSYLLYKLQPDFKTFIDLRDLDVFPQEFFSLYFSSTSSPAGFFSLDTAYKFDYAVVYRPEYPLLHRYLFNDSLYALTYVDAIAAVYEKTDSFTRNDIFSALPSVPSSDFARTLTNIFNPFFSPYNYEEASGNIAAAAYYMSVGAYGNAESRARIAMENRETKTEGEDMLGRICYYRALQQKDPGKRNVLLDQSLQLFVSIQKQNPDFAAAYAGAGAVYLKKKLFKAAANNFELAYQNNKTDASILLGCAESYLGLANVLNTNTNDNLNKALCYYLKCERLKPGNAANSLNIGILAYRLKKNSLSKKYLIEALDSRLLGPADQQKANDYLHQLQ